MKQFIQLSAIKLQNEYTFLNSVAPTVAEKAPNYINGDTWMDLVTGYSYILIDDALGTWKRTDQANDTKMTLQKDRILMTTIKDINNIFAIDRNAKFLNNTDAYYEYFPDGMPVEFTRKDAYKLISYESIYSMFTFAAAGAVYTITPEVDGLYGSVVDSFKVGDTIFIQGSRRNDSYYTITAIDALTNKITVLEPVIAEISNAYIYLCVVPEDFLQIVSRMVYYDVILRSKTSGLKSETIGTYSYTKDGIGNTLGYPDDIISGLDDYRLVPLGGHSLFVS